jgi:hypothetical protein
VRLSSIILEWKNKGLHFCVGYRKMNDIMKKDCFLLPSWQAVHSQMVLKQEIISFLNLCTHYRRFTSISGPVSWNCWPNSWRWCNGRQKWRNYSWLPTAIVTDKDASNFGIGGVLSQIQARWEWVITERCLIRPREIMSPRGASWGHLNFSTRTFKDKSSTHA